MPQGVGQVVLVGSGPGDPGLLTLRGRDCLARADVVLYDYLVNERILEHARRGAELVCLGRHGRDRIMSQDEINRLLVSRAQAGDYVVRLKGGDPAVFAHAAEEIAALEAAGITYEIVPGITAALASASYAGIPITHGTAASAVALVTGQEREGKEESNLDYAALAEFPGTLVFYMGVTTASHWTAALILNGKSAQTPAAIVHRCSWPDQRVILCTLSTVADEIERRNLRPPAVIVIGKVVAERTAAAWFAERPLFGTRVLVTRPRDQAGALYEELDRRGAHVLLQPAIEIAAPQDWQPVDRAIAQLDRYDWLVFSSANGVQFFLERIFAQGADARRLGRARIAAIGPGTAESLADYHLRADLVPPAFRAEALAEALAPQAAGRRFLLLRASRGREILGELLRQAGGDVEQIVVYESLDVIEADPEIRAALAAGEIHWVTVTSSAIARSLVNLFGDSLQNARLASISPVTSQTLRELGFEPSVEAAEYSMRGVADAICAAQSRAAR